jgi:hypothetical protein
LFQNGDQGFPAYADPCNGGGDDATVLAICQQQVVDAGGAPGFDFSDFGQNNSQVQAFAFGTTDLSEESAKTFTVGAVLTPNLGLGRFSATVDYYNIKIKDVIAAVGAQANLNACYGGGFPVLDAACANILRDPVTGQVVAVNTSVANQASLETSALASAVACASRNSCPGLTRSSSTTPSSAAATAAALAARFLSGSRRQPLPMTATTSLLSCGGIGSRMSKTRPSATSAPTVLPMALGPTPKSRGSATSTCPCASRSATTSS